MGAPEGSVTAINGLEPAIRIIDDQYVALRGHIRNGAALRGTMEAGWLTGILLPLSRTPISPVENFLSIERQGANWTFSMNAHTDRDPNGQRFDASASQIYRRNLSQF